MAVKPNMLPGLTYVFQLSTSPRKGPGTTAYHSVGLVVGSIIDQPGRPRDFLAKIYEYEMDKKAVPWIMSSFIRNWRPRANRVQHLQYVTTTSMTKKAIGKAGNRWAKTRKDYENTDNNCRAYVQNLIAKIQAHNYQQIRTHANQQAQSRQDQQFQASSDQQTISLWHAANIPNPQIQAAPTPQHEATAHQQNQHNQRVPQKRQAHQIQQIPNYSKSEANVATTPNFDHAIAVRPGMVPGLRYAFTLKWPLNPELEGDKKAFTEKLGFSHIALVVGSVVEENGRPKDFIATLYDFIEKIPHPKTPAAGNIHSGVKADSKADSGGQEWVTEANCRRWNYRHDDDRMLEFVTETTMTHNEIHQAGKEWAKDRKAFSVAANNCVAYVEHLLPLVKAAAPSGAGSGKTTS
ncbi:hypothetical protein MMC11_003192 [Xylographa trunciseda]|nr:hypothetical protein [Xylographa trunciseda]